MSNINHHLTDQLLMGYAAGTLPEAFNLVVATHISLCDECRARLGAHEAVGGALIEEMGSVAMAEASFDRTMSRINDRAKDPIMVQPPTKGDTTFPSPLQDYVGGDLSDVVWRNIAGGVRQSVLKTSNKATVRLLSIPAGVAMPDHGHRGTELTLVLQGAFRDEDGVYGRGDVEVADEGLEHTPVAEPGEDCICLAATDAPLRFNRLLPRIVQPFFGI